MRLRPVSQLVALGALLGAALVQRPAQACGGFFCSVQQPVNQAAERIIFADDGAGKITAVIQILYEGPAESFSWLLPISSVPEGDEIAVASDLAFQRLQQATNPLYTLTTRVEGECRESDARSSGAPNVSLPVAETCDDNRFLSGCPQAGGVSVRASGVVGAFAWTVIEVNPALPDPADSALDWLTENGYDVPPAAGALVGPYLADGMYLLALRLTKGSDTGAIRPIVLTYDADAPMIPIKLTAVAANEDMGVMTWALSSARAVPFNYSSLELNEARIDWFTGASNYNQVVTEAADAAGGQGFVTEFAGASNQLAGVVWTQVDEADWQDVREATYSSFPGMLERLRGTYETWDGFWEAVQSAVTLDEGISLEDFRRCPTCYSDRLTFSPTELLTAVEAGVIAPMRSVQALIDAAPYTTRLYSTLSAGEMTLDPVFVFNPDLPDVNNVHAAERVIECNADVSQFQAPWRIELPQGGVLRGTPDQVGTWPPAFAEQPANFRISTLAATGTGEVLADNAALIEGLLGDYNATPSGAPDPGPANSTRIRSDGGGCALSAPASGPRSSFGAGLAAFAALMGLALRRRRPS